jgi:branched-chain amino acid transport system substrate-binding protein
MKHLVVLLIGMTFIFGLSLGEASAETVRVAALYNLTGGMAAIDVPACDGAKLAAELINRKGDVLKGKKIELVVVDTQTDLEKAKTLAQEAAGTGIVAGIGYGDTSFVLAAAPAFQARGIPFVTSGATDPQLPKEIGACLFMVAYGDDDQAARMAEFAFHTLGVKRVAVWTNKSMDFGRLLSGYFKKSFTALGGAITADEPFDQGVEDFSSLIAKLKAPDSRAEALFVGGGPDDAAPIIAQVRRAGLTIPILSGDGFDANLAAALGKPEIADNVYFTTHSYRGETRPETLSFKEAYKKEFGREPEDAFAALGFDAVNLIADAIDRAGAVNPDALIKALSATRDFHAVTGEISYTRPNRVPVKPIAVIAIKQGAYAAMESKKP